MKRKKNSHCVEPAKKPKTDTVEISKPGSSSISDVDERKCMLSVGEKVIGFYGGWPYIGVISAVETVRMSFGLTFVFLVRWNGFSGKHAQSWVSEFDVRAYDDESIQMKQSMEDSLRQRTKEAGGKLSALELRKAVTEIVQEYRGKKLAPLRPQTCPYGDEWQTVVRVAAMPKQLVDHLQGSETLVYERKLCFNYSVPSLQNALDEWLTLYGDEANRAYADPVKVLFNSYLLKLLLYKFEIPLMIKRLIENRTDDYSTVCSVEYFVRFCNVFPQILTAACHGVMGKTDTPTMKTFFEFVNAHQSFMQFLVKNIERLLRKPRKAATLDESASELHWIGTFIRSESDIVDCDDPQDEDTNLRTKSLTRRIISKSKHKQRIPGYRPPKPTDISCP
jgi:hypothetical protein